jgi:hypothetical protein
VRAPACLCLSDEALSPIRDSAAGLCLPPENPNMNTRTATPYEILRAYIAGRDTWPADAVETFRKLACQLGEGSANLTADGLVEAADAAKHVAHDLRSLAHRVRRAAEDERRRRGAGR